MMSGRCWKYVESSTFLVSFESGIDVFCLGGRAVGHDERMLGDGWVEGFSILGSL
jgi:hypothetical protein